MTTLNVTTRSYFRTMNILYLGLIAGQVSFILIILWLRVTGQSLPVTFPPEISLILRYLVPALALVSVATGWLLFSAKIKALKELPVPYPGYRSACLFRYALLEGASIPALVFFLLSNDYLFLCISVLILAAFLAIRPSKEALIKHLQLPYEQQILLQDPEAVLYEEQRLL